MKIISGGQTGVDRAALDMAMECGMTYGGYIPQGRKAEDGRLSEKYNNLIELNETDYKIRTELNVVESDATLILYAGLLFGGTLLTKDFAIKNNKPYLCINLRKEKPNPTKQIKKWLEIVQPETLNIAGPRESSHIGIYEKSKALLREVFKLMFEH
ncbi:MAG: hypothetical protein A2Y40_09720 [Candidatus Margulisbacteria bacterium GWF2_35_9]|nr:MAG: hypothetical protein A2Y40_09720 [Candidatus Margulisbacteria bacterium GWF2_35_9]